MIRVRMLRIRFLLLAALASATAVADPITLSAPAPEATLRGGTFATLAWSAQRLPPQAEEWEAFLSIDGGQHFVLRITPHLDVALQGVTWLVPNVDARDARILIRMGNEREERAFALPKSFAIERDAGAPLPPLRMTPASRAEEGVVAWAEGDRQATRVAQAASVVPPGAMRSLHVVRAEEPAPADAPKQWRQAVEPLALAPARLSSTQSRERETSSPHNPDILLLSRRRNI
jgi:hypothetical protein